MNLQRFVPDELIEPSHWHTFVNTGIWTSIPVTERVEFSTRASITYQKMGHDCGCIQPLIALRSDFSGLFFDLSLGAGLFPLSSKALKLDVFLNMESPLAFKGVYTLYQFHSGSSEIDTLSFGSNLISKANELNIGPGIGVSFRLNLGKAGMLWPGIRSSIGLGRTWRKDFDTPFNPRPFRIGFDLAYQFPKKQTE
jgi:hypothetical protein